MVKRMVPFCVLGMLLVAALSGCNDDPGVSLVGNLYIVDNPDSTLKKTVNIVKTNGYRQDDLTYVAEITVTDKMRISCKEFEQSNKAGGLGALTEMMAIWAIYGHDFQRGDEISHDLQVTLLRKERGWEIVEYKRADER